MSPGNPDSAVTTSRQASSALASSRAPAAETLSWFPYVHDDKSLQLRSLILQSASTTVVSVPHCGASSGSTAPSQLSSSPLPLHSVCPGWTNSGRFVLHMCLLSQQSSATSCSSPISSTIFLQIAYPSPSSSCSASGMPLQSRSRSRRSMSQM